ncbi:hypothetical protein [Candidatus Poriferisodalis sp.]|uniref:hypothetical protein n=1 Tax=Candidatus Poriferisodalis sp. TaxID=3101277 RepID=UPI003B01FA1B
MRERITRLKTRQTHSAAQHRVRRRRATAFIDWDGIFVSTPMWDLAHAVWQFAPLRDDADRWLGGRPSPPDRSARIAALVGGCRLGAERADELADMAVEVIAGCARSSLAPPVGLLEWLRIGLDAPPTRMPPRPVPAPPQA